ncbi:unnamed protein product [Linum tenue]|uniref:Uncharacterized protein n=1 Tax=Linum tenue TaxID=586396 RepID=A0AAV0Q3L0_9ROSI|nr:unnamed protein product [Linum tenue]
MTSSQLAKSLFGIDEASEPVDKLRRRYLVDHMIEASCVVDNHTSHLLFLLSIHEFGFTACFFPMVWSLFQEPLLPFL